jgi:hypothetical protein
MPGALESFALRPARTVRFRLALRSPSSRRSRRELDDAGVLWHGRLSTTDLRRRRGPKPPAVAPSNCSPTLGTAALNLKFRHFPDCERSLPANAQRNIWRRPGVAGSEPFGCRQKSAYGYGLSAGAPCSWSLRHAPPFALVHVDWPADCRAALVDRLRGHWPPYKIVLIAW